MSEQAMTELTETGPLVRSGVKIETTAKGMAQLKVQVYEGTSEDEMQRLKDLAIKVYEKALQELAQRTEIAG